MSAPTSTQSPHTIEEAIELTFTICYYTFSIVFTILLMVFEVWLSHLVLHRVCYGRFFPSPSNNMASSTPADTEAALESESSADSLLLTTADSSDKTAARSSAPAAVSNTNTEPNYLNPVTALNGFILLIIPLLTALLHEPERNEQGTLEVHWGRDFAFGLIPASFVLFIFVLVEVVCIKAWRVFNASGEKPR